MVDGNSDNGDDEGSCYYYNNMFTGKKRRY